MPGLDQLWSAVDDLIARSTLDGILVHGLGPLAAGRLRRLDSQVPDALLRQERVAALSPATALPLLERVRSSCEGPLVLFKGPELARLYPAAARPFGDLDLLAPDAPAVQQALITAGFVVEGSEVPASHHHLQPLRWPPAQLHVEVHSQVNWPRSLDAPSVAEILAASVPSSVGIEGIAAPSAAHHALILAVHGWQHRPLRVLRDLIDVAVAASEADPQELDRLAATWHVERIWRSTRDAARALFFEGPLTPSLRTWARSLAQARERTPAEIDLEALVSSWWQMTARETLVYDARLVGRRVARRLRRGPPETDALSQS